MARRAPLEKAIHTKRNRQGGRFRFEGQLGTGRRMNVAEAEGASAELHPRSKAILVRRCGPPVVDHFLFRASLQRPSFQYMNVPQLPGRFAEAIRGCAGTARRALREVFLGPAW
jgi:hypothetical protein